MLYQFKLFFLIFCFAGFGLVSFMPDLLGFMPRSITITYRSAVFLSSAFLILVSLANIKLHVKLTSLISLLLIVAYLLRLSGDSHFNFCRSFAEIIVLAVGVSFVPAIALFTLKSNRVTINALDKLIICFFLIVCMAIFNGLTFGYSYRLAGNSILNPITLGHFASSGIILIAVKWLSSNDLKLSYLDKWLTSICLLVFFIALIMANSRGPVFALFLTLGYYVFPKLRYILSRNLFVIVITLTLISFALIIPTEALDLFKGRMTIDFSDGGDGGEARVFLWAEGINIFIQNPLFGKQTTTSMGYPHSLIIEMLMSVGVIGTALFLYVFFHCLNKTKLLDNSKSLLIWPGLLFIQYFVGSLFSGTLYSNNMLWYSMALLLSVNLDDLYKATQK